MSEYRECWYWCDLLDLEAVPEEPDWSRVPEERREAVRTGWQRRSQPKPQRVKLWGPQIPIYQSRPYYRVEVIGPVETGQDHDGGT